MLLLFGFAFLWPGQHPRSSLELTNFLLLSCTIYPILHTMYWALAGLTLVVTGVVLRRLMRLDEPPPQSRGFVCLDPKHEEVYEPVSLEVETQSLLLAISLNEALGEQKAGSIDSAWLHVRLAAGQWERLAEIVVCVLDTIDDHVPNANSTLHSRNMDRLEFRSCTMVQFVPVRTLLDQLIFRSKVRYQVHLRVLRSAVEALAREFSRMANSIQAKPDASPDGWESLDPAFHDFDLIIKETLLYMRAFLFAVGDLDLPAFATDINNAISRRSVRSRANLLLQ